MSNLSNNDLGGGQWLNPGSISETPNKTVEENLSKNVVTPNIVSEEECDTIMSLSGGFLALS